MIGKTQISWLFSNNPIDAKEVQLFDYRIFGGIANNEKFKWIQANNGNIPKNAIPLGNEENGNVIFAARAHYCDGLHPGALIRGKKFALIPYGNYSQEITNYEVLCYDKK